MFLTHLTALTSTPAIIHTVAGLTVILPLPVLSHFGFDVFSCLYVCVCFLCESDFTVLPFRWMNLKIAVSLLKRVPITTGGFGPWPPEPLWARSESPSSCCSTELPAAGFSYLAERSTRPSVRPVVFADCSWWMFMFYKCLTGIQVYFCLFWLAVIILHLKCLSN